MLNENEKRMLEEIKRGLKPPTQEELDRVTAKWLFGKHAEKMMKYAPWSFVLKRCSANRNAWFKPLSSMEI